MRCLKAVSKIQLFFISLLICDYALGAGAINSQSDKKPLETTQSPIIEYYKDHEITEKQARESLVKMDKDDFQSAAHCKLPCPEEHNRYCFSSELLKDHCCCNQSHKKGKHALIQAKKNGKSIKKLNAAPTPNKKNL